MDYQQRIPPQLGSQSTLTRSGGAATPSFHHGMHSNRAMVAPSPHLVNTQRSHTPLSISELKMNGSRMGSGGTHSNMATPLSFQYPPNAVQGMPNSRATPAPSYARTPPPPYANGCQPTVVLQQQTVLQQQQTVYHQQQSYPPSQQQPHFQNYPHQQQIMHSSSYPQHPPIPQVQHMNAQAPSNAYMLQQQQQQQQQQVQMQGGPSHADSINSMQSNGARSRSLSRNSKSLQLRVLLLDGTVPKFDIPPKATGFIFLEAVFKHLNLHESDYFGMQYAADYAGSVYWLELDKQISKQIKNPTQILFRFAVKFYTAEPDQLQDDFTKVLFAMQIKRDLACGMLPCSESTAALMASYIVQAELGDYVFEQYKDEPRYLCMFKFVPEQTEVFLNKVMEYHRNHIGQAPAEADFNVLDIARRLDMYGLRLHPVRDSDNILLHIAVNYNGILVFKQNNKVNTFTWPKIRKLSFKKKIFLIKLHPESSVNQTQEYLMTSRNACKRFWKDCIEHHAFFRLPENKFALSSDDKKPPLPPKLLHSGSSFRFGGRTQKQMSDFVRKQMQTKVGGRSMYHTLPTPNSSSGQTQSPYPSQPMAGPSNARSQTPSYNTKGGGYAPPPPNSHTLPTGRTYDRRETLTQQRPGSVTPSGRPPMPNPAPIQPYLAHIDRQQPAAVIPNNPDSDHDYENFPLPAEIGIAALNQMMTVPPHLQQHRTEEARADTHSIGSDKSHDSATITPFHTQSSYPSVGMESYVNQDGMSSQRSSQRMNSLPRQIDHHSDVDVFGSTNMASPDIMRTVSPLVVASQSEANAAHRRDSENSSAAAMSPIHEEEEYKQRRIIEGKPYFVAKEILTTERTYLKDLEVVTSWFRKAIGSDSTKDASIIETLFRVIEPIYEFHCSFLKEIEQRLSLWESKPGAMKGDYQRIGDIMKRGIVEFKSLYQLFLKEQESLLTELETSLGQSKNLESLFKEFEQQKVCYLPFTSFLLKPSQRLLHYELVLKKLLEQYGEDHRDYSECDDCLNALKDLVANVNETLPRLEHYQKLSELQRDLIGVKKLLSGDRRLTREGCLYMYSKKGYQQRMFFLFSDVLLYTRHGVTPTNQFRIHGSIPMTNLKVEDSAPDKQTFSFTLDSEGRSIVLAASSEREKRLWLEDIQAVSGHCTSMSDLEITADSENAEDEDSASQRQKAYHRSNTTMHVCWHRNTSVAMVDHIASVHNQLSGYLLRKFKNSNGWQKLWVVFTNFCLFFYKTYQDDYPLASLPLLGYSITHPLESDNINKNYVFKLQFKTHIYFFRAESNYTYSRWLEVIQCATETA